MVPKSLLVSAKSLSFLVVGITLFCATPFQSFAESPVTTPFYQETEGEFISQTGSYPFGSDSRVDLLVKKGKVYLTLSHDLITKKETITIDPKNGAKIVKTATKKSSTTNTEVISKHPDAPWFVYLAKNGEIWAFDGRKTLHTSKTVVKGDTSSTVSKSETFKEKPSEQTPKRVSDRILEIQGNGPKAANR